MVGILSHFSNIVANLIYFLRSDLEHTQDVSLGRLQKTDARGLVPHDVVATQVHGQDEYEKGITHGILAATEVRAEQVAVVPGLLLKLTQAGGQEQPVSRTDRPLLFTIAE